MNFDSQIKAMVNKISFVLLFAFIVLSCSKDDLKEEIIFNDGTDLSEETTSQPAEEDNEEQPLSSIQKTANWVTNIQQPNGLLESSENTNFVSLYDNALAALVFIDQGALEKAERILDFFNGKTQTELQSGTGGFYQFRDSNGENGSRTWMGDNAWLLIAINHYHEASGNQKYDDLSQKIEDWLRSLQDTDGSLRGGFNEDGTAIPKVTEGILTAFNAVKGYDDFHKNILSYLKENRWNAQENVLVAWPENPDYNYALDLHGLSFGILKNFPETVLTKADRYTNTQIATVTGKELTGYCFDDDKDVIWLEGTAQMAVAYQLAKNDTKANELVAEIEKTFITSTVLENAIGLPYTANFGTTYGTNQLWDHADIAPALSTTAWYLFAKMKFNPLTLGKEKAIPEADQFWIQN